MNQQPDNRPIDPELAQLESALQRHPALLKLLRAEDPRDATPIADLLNRYLDPDAGGMGELGVLARVKQIQVLALYRAAYGHRLIGQARAIDLNHFIASHAQWRSGWSKKRAAAIVKRAINWAVQMGLARFNPFDGIAFRQGGRRRPMTDQELRHALRFATPEGRLANGPMLRKDLIRALRGHGASLETIHRARRRLQVRACKIEGQPAYMLPKPKTLRTWPAATADAAGVVFPSPLGKAWAQQQLVKYFERLRNRAGLPEDCRMYGLRHRFVTKAIIRKVNLKTVATLVGHKSTAMSEHYAHLGDDTRHLREAVNQVHAKGGAA